MSSKKRKCSDKSVALLKQYNLSARIPEGNLMLWHCLTLVIQKQSFVVGYFLNFSCLDFCDLHLNLSSKGKQWKAIPSCFSYIANPNISSGDESLCRWSPVCFIFFYEINDLPQAGICKLIYLNWPIFRYGDLALLWNHECKLVVGVFFNLR